jgi:hypothetical protein
MSFVLSWFHSNSAALPRIALLCHRVLNFCPFDVARVTLLMKVKSLVASFAKRFGHWMLESDRDIDQFAAILFGNYIHRICVL